MRNIREQNMKKRLRNTGTYRKTQARTTRYLFTTQESAITNSRVQKRLLTFTGGPSQLGKVITRRPSMRLALRSKIWAGSRKPGKFTNLRSIRRTARTLLLPFAWEYLWQTRETTKPRQLFSEQPLLARVINSRRVTTH